jgi:hypothetical protein
MPFCIEPSPRKRGPGSALGTGSGKKQVRRSRAARSNSAKLERSGLRKPDGFFIGQDLVEWQQKSQSGSGKCIVKEKTLQGSSIRAVRFNEKSRSQEIHIGSNTTSGPTKISTFSSSSQTPPHRALALDTRFLNNKEGQQIGKEILARYDDFIQTLAARGLEPHTIFTTICKDKTEPRPALCLEIIEGKPCGAWLSPSEDRGDEGACIPKTLEGESSWKVIHDFGKCDISTASQEKNISFALYFRAY